MTFPEEIIDKIFEYERHILMTEHLPRYKYVLKDIKEGLKIILTDPDWHKKYYREIDDVFHYQFPWKVSDWVQQPLEGAALYIGRERIVCSKRVPRGFEPEFCHPYYRSVMKLHSSNLKGNPKLWGKQAKLVKHMYFHR